MNGLNKSDWAMIIALSMAIIVFFLTIFLAFGVSFFSAGLAILVSASFLCRLFNRN